MARLVINDIAEWRKSARASGYRAWRLAGHLGISRRQLTRYTRSVFGRSPQDWLNAERLNDAPERLKTVRSVKTVAFELGFKQRSHFSREFKLTHGVSPTSFLAAADFQSPSQSQPLNPS
jgi:AraC-like DNA-binding protein